MSSRASRSVRVSAKALVRPGTALVMQRLPRLPSLSDASMATGRLLSEASTSISSALRRTLIAFRSWRRLSAWMVARTSSCRLACTDCRACRKGSGLVERWVSVSCWSITSRASASWNLR